MCFFSSFFLCLFALSVQVKNGFDCPRRPWKARSLCGARRAVPCSPTTFSFRLCGITTAALMSWSLSSSKPPGTCRISVNNLLVSPQRFCRRQLPRWMANPWWCCLGLLMINMCFFFFLLLFMGNIMLSIGYRLFSKSKVESFFEIGWRPHGSAWNRQDVAWGMADTAFEWWRWTFAIRIRERTDTSFYQKPGFASGERFEVILVHFTSLYVHFFKLSLRSAIR